MSETTRPACSRPDLAGLLPRFEFGCVSEDEQLRFETHALDCDACFAELERGSVVAATLREQSARYAGILEAVPVTATAPPRRPGGRAGMRSLRAVARTLRPRVAVPALVAVCLAVFAVTRLAGPSDPRRLARFPRQSLGSDLVRGGQQSSEAAREALQTGAAYFDIGRYAEAERWFRAAAARAPDQVEPLYLAGLCRALGGDAAGAVPDLERAAALAAEPLRSDVDWVLANAYLAAGRSADARRVLAALAEGGGPHGREARALLGKLQS